MASSTATAAAETVDIAAPIPYPNPVTAKNENSILVRLNFKVEPGESRLVLMTLSMRKIVEIPLGVVPPGELTLELPVIDKTGRSLANGLYYVAIITSRGTAVGKLLVLR